LDENENRKRFFNRKIGSHIQRRKHQPNGTKSPCIQHLDHINLIRINCLRICRLQFDPKAKIFFFFLKVIFLVLIPLTVQMNKLFRLSIWDQIFECIVRVWLCEILPFFSSIKLFFFFQNYFHVYCWRRVKWFLFW